MDNTSVQWALSVLLHKTSHKDKTCWYYKSNYSALQRQPWQERQTTWMKKRETLPLSCVRWSDHTKYLMIWDQRESDRFSSILQTCIKSRNTTWKRIYKNALQCMVCYATLKAQNEAYLQKKKKLATIRMVLWRNKTIVFMNVLLHF